MSFYIYRSEFLKPFHIFFDLI